MKVSVDNQELFTLSNVQKKVIKNDIHEDEFDSDMKRRLEYILTHKYERCYERLVKEWMPKLQQRYQSIPTNSDQVAELIFTQADYKSRKQRETV
jgi:hypothetical protein